MSYADKAVRRAELIKKLGLPFIEKILNEQAQERINQAAALGIYEQVKRLRVSTLLEVMGEDMIDHVPWETNPCL